MSTSDPISPSQPLQPQIDSVSVRPPEDPVWNLVDVLMIALFALLAVFFIGLAALVVAHLVPRFHNVKTVDLAQSALVLVPAETVAYLFVVAFMVQIVRLRNRGDRAPWDSSRRSRGIREAMPSDFLSSVRWNTPGLNTALGALAGGAVLAWMSGVFTYFLQRWIPKSLPIDELFRDRNSAYLLALFGVLVAPLVEELFFRGFLYPVLARHLGSGISIVFTAAAFAVIHQGQLARAWVPLAWLFVVGVVLTTVRARTKSVATSVLIHVAYNATLFLLLFIYTQGFRHMERA